MEETPQTPVTPAETKARRRAPAKKKASTPRPAARKKAPARPKAAAKAGRLETMLESFSKSASRAGASISAVSGESVRSAKKAWNQAGVASKSTVKRVLKEWRDLDPKRRAQYVAALLAALAAASAPVVRARLKKR